MTYEIIHVSISDPSSSLFKSAKNDKASCRIVSCSMRAECAVYAKGQCIMLNTIRSQCPFGKSQVERGFTARASGYREWISTRRKKYEGMNKLTSAAHIIARVGPLVYLPYPFWNMNKSLPLDEYENVFVSGSTLVPVSTFTPEFVVNMVKFKPQALMGGEIKSYQKDVVPMFVKHLSEVMPVLFESVRDAYPEIDGYLSRYSYVGRKAYVHTLAPGTIVTKYHDSAQLTTQHWTWDGEFLSSSDAGISFPITPYTESLVKIKPDSKATVKITSDDQVDVNTKFME